MADLILGSIVDSITGHAVSLISQEIGLACGVKGELKKLRRTVSLIEALLREADKRHVKSEVVRVWLGELEDVVYDADDLLDDFSSEASLRRSVKGGGKRILNEVRTFFSSSNQIIYASRVAHHVKDIRESIDAITNDKVRFELGARTGSIPGSLVENRVRPETIPFESKPYVIGRDKDKKKVIELLLNPQNEESVSILPIVGIGGIGKTTLARLVLNDESVKEYFEPKLWVCVSTNFNVEDILRKIVRECTQDKEVANLNMNELQKRLGEELGRKRFLLVLDDVWNENRDMWLDLQGFLMNGAKGSTIMVTTRSPRVAKTMAATFHELSGLPEDESLSLLMQVAMKDEHEWRNQIESIAKEILKKCVGVPLAITTMGRLLLFTRNTEEDWLNFMSNDLSRIDQEENDIMPSLRLSYDFLPSHLKQCFAYCSLFPKDYELDPSMLICLWMAQGFIKSQEKRKTLEEIGQEYFMELVSRSFFQDLEEDLLGNVTKCKMHDLMHDLAKSVAGDNCITIDGSPTSEISRLARHVSILDREDHELKGSGMERIRSMLNLGRYDYSTTEIRHLDLSRFRNLRALCIRCTEIESLPDSIGKLKHLRSLDLAYNDKLRSLPNSIGMLCNLQSLDLSWLDLERIPRGITKLVNLRRLNVSECLALKHMPRGIGKLTSLQMLSDFWVGENGDSNAASLNELSRLTGLGKKLRIQYLNRLGTNISRELDASFSIDKLALQSLELSWEPYYRDPSEHGANDEKILERLRPHSDLKRLVISNCSGTRLSSWISQLRKLVVIKISNCQCKYLSPLDHLPCLKSITLAHLSILEWIELSESVTQQQSLFPSLQKLKLVDLRAFKGWMWRRRGNANRIEGGEEDIQDEDMEGSSNLSMFPTFSDKVKVTVAGCERFSYMDQRVLQLSENVMENWLQLRENVASHAPHSPFTMTFVSVSSIPLFAPTLTSLALRNLEDTEKLPSELFRIFPSSLKSLEIWCCVGLRSLPWKAILRYLTALETLEISFCEELNLSIEDDGGDDVTDEHVHDLQLHGHHKLSELRIWGIDKMESLPGWIQHLTNLERLSLRRCRRLESLPGWLCQLTSLKHLEIANCGTPRRRDWPNIPPHIHDVDIRP